MRNGYLKWRLMLIKEIMKIGSLTSNSLKNSWKKLGVVS
jgi:cytochrome c oxidase subunit IV